MKNLKNKKLLYPLVGVILLVIIAFSNGFSKEKNDEIYKYLKLFSQVLKLIEDNYVTEVSPKDLIYGAINGMLNSLDPYSSLMKPEEFKELEIETKGTFTGIGIEITIKDDIITVVAPIEDTPAWKAGIKPGDKILKIEDKPTKGMSLIEAVKLLRGPKGTKVKITILRNDKDIKEITLVRDVIPIKSVKVKVLEPGYAYVRITKFQEKTHQELIDVLEELEKKELKGIVLDLRYNPGGLLSSAIDVADEFLEKGVIVSIKGKSKDSGMVFEAKPNPSNRKHHYPIVILINHGTASASEIVTGALKDHKRALVLGQKSFGKGRVQTVIPLDDGYAVKLTTAFYYTPSGVCIDKIGISPNIEIPAMVEATTKEKSKDKDEEDLLKPWTSPEEDFQVKMALSILKNLKEISKLKF
ncbi:MAG: Carboxyl-terminal protease [Thermodesulfobacterium commune]|jgi:carboxyl-terminal processing protease|uniref:Peptidase S41 n=1 Tax=Thermodesulfobacterium commune TaxID=1741 RepID=A0A124FKM2_9BACT|nr:MAG: Carboxyl-terminal protease [Thermodesulfobacterium commune]MDK2862009.1 carboxyl-terminal processing protease [Thermodesulfobacterium sp.]HAA84153.1 peptidase S41 [Thermodesulfobacterium commune]